MALNSFRSQSCRVKYFTVLPLNFVKDFWVYKLRGWVELRVQGESFDHHHYGQTINLAIGIERLFIRVT